MALIFDISKIRRNDSVYGFKIDKIIPAGLNVRKQLSVTFRMTDGQTHDKYKIAAFWINNFKIFVSFYQEREGTMDCLLHQPPKFYNNVFFFAG